MRPKGGGGKGHLIFVPLLDRRMPWLRGATDEYAFKLVHRESHAPAYLFRNLWNIKELYWYSEQIGGLGIASRYLIHGTLKLTRAKTISELDQWVSVGNFNYLKVKKKPLVFDRAERKVFHYGGPRMPDYRVHASHLCTRCVVPRKKIAFAYPSFVQPLPLPPQTCNE